MRGSKRAARADSTGHDDSDLLGHLDDARRRELQQWNEQRWRDLQQRTGWKDSVDWQDCATGVEGARGEPTAAQVFSGAWRECWSGMLRARRGEYSSSSQPPDAAIRPEADEVNEDIDLLARLADERRKELSRATQRRFRANHRPASVEQHCDETFENELTAEERAACLTRLQNALGADGLDECVCAACDRLVLRQDARRVEDTDSSYLLKMKKQLTVDTTDIPEKLVDMYRAPDHLTALVGATISPRGIHTFTDDDSSLRSWISICSECDRSIKRGKLPKFAIGNGFFVGRLPKHLQNLTIPERLMTQLVHVAALTRVMRGGRHRCIRSHCIAFDCTPGPPVTLLPREMNDVASYRVVMVGEFTAPQAVQVRKLHRIRSREVQAVFDFYKDNNHLYSSVDRNESVLSSQYTDDDVEQTFVERVEDPGGNVDNAINREQESVRGESDVWRLANLSNECHVIERRIGLAEDGAPVAVSEDPAVLKVAKEREFEIRRSNQFANDISGSLLARMFPHLFPFGRGHPGEARKSTVSVLECVKHYTLLSERQFAEDELFSLVAFDRISLQNMYIQNHFRCQHFPHLLDGYENLSGERLGRALLENERRRQGCLPWKQCDDSVAQRFLKTVEVSTRSIWGSNAERAQCRYKAFAYQARFGQPALFVTLTPNTDNSLVLAQYTGISSVETLFDLLASQVPSKADLREASRGNDCASARLFMRHVDAFIRYVLGIDTATRKRLSFRGLLGDVKAYFGMVETQGRGTLHVHFLIWLNRCPPNSAAVEAILNSPEGDHFRERVISYADHIVSNELPVRLEECCCSECGASFASLTGLPITDTARKDPRARTRIAQFRCTAAEPLLVECSRCGMQCSSQHLIRSALLKSRPSYWPVWKSKMSPRDLEQQIAKEVVCRDTRAQAMNIICERETLHASFSSEPLTHENEVLTAELLQQANARQMSLCTSDDDPFRNDWLTRLLEVSPPSALDARMAKRSLNYMVSVLVVLLNQHLWSHTTSCFKQSGVTVNDSYCRYRFPQHRVAATKFGVGGVELKRTLGHEYINGFNYEIMASFKCNHDVQILLGGSDVTDRIHYCCKYVTKQQKQLDSQVAVAVAALSRREQREAVETATDGTSNRLARARKRVAALVYNMTNRQEIAGPLAALYLYRGSCCYSSAGCVMLPAGDAVRQLTMAEDYSCDLISDNEGLEASHFRAVSALDDYIYRPRKLDRVNFYEFTMRYFRKKTDSCKTAALRFLDQHPLSDSYCLGQRYEDAVPIIQGFRVPSADGEASLEKQCKLAVLSLLLFKPFRELKDLIGASDCSDEQVWLDYFERWKPTRSKFVEEIMNNMNDFYSGRAKAKDQRESTMAAGENEGADEHLNDEDDDLFRAGDDDVDGVFSGGVTMQEQNEFRSLWEIEGSADTVLESTSVDPATCPTSAAPASRIASMIETFKRHDLIQPAAEFLVHDGNAEPSGATVPSLETMKKWVQNSDTDNGFSPSAPPTAILPRDTKVVELLDDGLREASQEWRPPDTLCGSPTLSTTFSSIADVSKVFTLNERQHDAFKAIAKALLTRWRSAENAPSVGISLTQTLSENQLLIFLGGEGGTGKTRIVSAVQAFCESWGRSQAIVKTALTGKAATIIRGRTLAGFLLQIRKKKVSDEVANLDLVFIDEVSMMKKFQLAQLDKYLRVAKRVSGVAFGGVHIVLVGDFLQLPPVGGEPLFKAPIRKGRLSANELAGYQLLREFKNVVILKESVRFQKDPEWGRGCHQARLGVWTSEFVQVINSRVITSEHPIQQPVAEAVATFVTPDNATRLSINNLYISTAAKLLPEGEYPVRVVANFKGKLNSLRRDEVRMIMQLPDTKFGRMAPYLDLIVGMPIQVTQNVRAAKSVANGTLGTLADIIYQPGTTFRLVHDSTADVTVKVPSLPPPVVLVRINRGECASAMVGCADADLFPLFFDAKAYSACNIALAGILHGVPRTLSVRMEQFPLVCAVSSTVYKVQGETLDTMVVTEWRSKGKVANKREQPYLLVSRVTSRFAFATLTPMTTDIVEWAHPSRAALAEEERLERLSDVTIQRLRAQ